jgi:Ca-activated chloride channel family protein
VKFLWPDLLWLLLALPALVAAYVWLLRRRKKAAVRYASLAMVREAMGAGSRLRRHVPPLLLLAAVALMLLAVARPVSVISVPSRNETLILAMDVSGSMRATDVKPNRIQVAQEAAKAFVADLPRSVRVGVVSFAATASVVQAPTRNREDVIAAIDRFQLQRGTAIGSAIVVSLATIFPNSGIDLATLTYARDARESRKGTPIDKARKGEDKDAKGKDAKAVEPGSYDSAAIVLLTDGQRTAGPDALEAAKMAADRGVRVFTVGFGTREGETMAFEGWSMRVRLDEDALKAISTLTRGEFFRAGSEADLRKVYEALGSRLVMEKRETEVSALFAAAGAALALVSALLSMLWFNRVL